MKSLKLRYIIKLCNSIINALINLAIVSFVPKTLGPAAFGSFSYIRDTMQSIIVFMDLNFSTAHINYASRKDKSFVATSLYFTFTMFVGLILIVLLIIITAFDLIDLIFQGLAGSGGADAPAQRAVA